MFANAGAYLSTAGVTRPLKYAIRRGARDERRLDETPRTPVSN
jgi:hypothetical protein